MHLLYYSKCSPVTESVWCMCACEHVTYSHCLSCSELKRGPITMGKKV